MNKYIEKVAAGLRNMKTKPDAFLVVEQEGWCWDKGKILGIPVYHTEFVYNNMTDSDIRFIPLWNSEGDYIIERKRFNDGYESNSQ